MWTVNAVIHHFPLDVRRRIHEMAPAVDKLWMSERERWRPDRGGPAQPPIANISTLGSDEVVARERSSE